MKTAGRWWILYPIVGVMLCILALGQAQGTQTGSNGVVFWYKTSGTAIVVVFQSVGALFSAGQDALKSVPAQRGAPWSPCTPVAPATTC